MHLTAKHILAAAAFCATLSSGLAANVYFRDTTGNHDLADPDNWDSSWSSGDTLFVSYSTVSLPSTSLRISRDMNSSTEIKIDTYTSSGVSVTIDCGGHSLNTATLTTLRTSSVNATEHLLLTGGFSGVDTLWTDALRSHVYFASGIFRVKNMLQMGDRYARYYVRDDAELIVETINSDNQSGLVGWDKGNRLFCVDGGKFAILGHTTSSGKWRRVLFEGYKADDGGASAVKVINGGEFRDDDTYPNILITCDLLVKDASFLQTNAANVARNMRFAGTRGTFEITNSVFRVAQLYCGPYVSWDYGYNNELTDNLSGRTIDFCDSEETFAFKPGWDGKTYSGICLPMAAPNNTILFRGERNRFTSNNFLLGGSNTVAVTGGSFAVSNAFEFGAAQAGSGSTLLFKDADVYLGALQCGASATNTRVSISGTAKVKGGGTFMTGGYGSSLRSSDEAVVDLGENKFHLKFDGSELFLGGLASTGTVSFTASGCTATIAGTNHRTELGASSHVAPFWFEEGKENNVLVISNATFDCQGWASKSHVATSEGPEVEPVPFTGCPGCRIEFRGSTPKLLFSSAKSRVGGSTAWYSAAFGEMIDRTENKFTRAAYPLTDPVRLRFVLPPSTNSYAEAPVQSTSGLIALGGNAEFEFDMSEYDWPHGSQVIPLVCDQGRSFRGWGNRRYIDVDQLNRTNAERMPVNNYGNKAGRFKLSDDGKTLYFVVVNTGATIFVVR